MASSIKIKTLTEPTVFPVDLYDAKDQAVIEHSNNDAQLEAMIAAATSHVETVTGQSLVMQQKRLYLDKFSDAIYLPKGPVQAIQQVQYIDTDGVTQTLASSVYQFDDVEPYLRLAYNRSWPDHRYQANAVWIDYWCGYYDASSSPIDLTAKIPAALKHAVLMLVAEFDRNREARNELETYDNPAFDALVAPYRVYLQ